MNTINLKIKVQGQEANATIELTNDNIKELYKSFKYGKQSVNGLTTQISQGFNNAREILIGFNEVANVFKNTFGKSIQLYGVQEKAEKQLATALGYRSKALLEYASAQQKVTTHGDEEIINAQALIAAFIKDEEQIKKLTKATLDLADAKGMDLVSAADLISKSVGSSTNALSRYGIEVKGAVGSNERLESLLKNVNERFGGQAEAIANLPTGKMQQFSNLMGDIQERVGEGIARVIAPTLDGLKYLLNIIDSISPSIINVGVTFGMFGGAVLLLKTLGIMPLANSFRVMTMTLMANVKATVSQIAANNALSASNVTLATTARAAGVGIKSMFSAMGPVGWIIIAFTTLIELANLFGGKIEDVTKKVEELNNKTLEQLRTEQKLLEAQYKTTVEQLELKKISLEQFEKRGKELTVQEQVFANNLRAEVFSLMKLELKIKEDLLPINDEILKQEKLITDTVKSRYETLKKQIEVDYAKTNTEANLIKLKQQHEQELDTLTEALELKIIKQKEYEETLTKLTEIYNKKREEILKKAPKQVTGIYAKLNAEIKKLNEQKENAKTINELIVIEQKINTLTSKKNYIEFQVAISGRDINDFSDVKAKGPGEIKAKGSNGIDVNDEANSYYELARMKIEATEFGIERERQLRELQKSEDLERFKDVKDSEKIINDYYLKQKEASEKQAALNSVQTTMDALGFIAGVVNEQTAVGKAIAVAQATWNTYQAATAALGAQPWGLWNIGLAAMVTGAGLANVAKIIESEPPQMKGYAQGGRFRKGESGYIEGYHNGVKK